MLLYREAHSQLYNRGCSRTIGFFGRHTCLKYHELSQIKVSVEEMSDNRGALRGIK
jgi:hypothetical protein